MTKRICKYPNKLKELREQKGLTQTEVSVLLDFGDSQDRISKWEKGIGLPNIPNLLKLARFYNVAPQDVYPEL
jgi:transcriptional regulator with XRE-family HTH domain